APGYTDTPGGRVALINCASSFAAWSPAVYARGDFKGVPGLNAVRVQRRYQLEPAAFAGVETAARSLGSPPPPEGATRDHMARQHVRPRAHFRFLERSSGR